MLDYKAPVRDMRFILHEVLSAEPRLAEMYSADVVNRELIDAVLEEAARIAETRYAPVNRSGDEQGCRLVDGKVHTPEGFVDAYRTFAEGGWVGLTGDPTYGGQGMPKMLAVCVEEMMMGANSALALYGVLSAGSTLVLAYHADEALRKMYLPPIYEGRWAATMCLTEAHAGTDLGLIRTRATPDGKGAYRLSGSKMFITGGEHDLTENIVHLVLARLPDAPEGTRGISLFLVPKRMPQVDDSGRVSVGDSNNVHCASIEDKMGLKGSATCVLNFDDATGYLVGEVNRGLACMFTMMNYERLTVGLQGLALGEASYQTAANYARERLQGRAATGPENPDGSADPLLVHPDVRRMLLTMRANTEAARALAAYIGLQLDTAASHPDAASREKAGKLVALLTPVAKAAFTDRGFEACVLGQQVLGGHGYIKEWGQEQHVRDARIAQIYEGTNGIQALDLMGRKVVYDREGLLDALLDEIKTFVDKEEDQDADFAAVLEDSLAALVDVTATVKSAAQDNPNEVGAASVAYLELLALIMYCFMWAQMISRARQAVASQTGEASFYQTKIHVGRYFLQRLMPRYKSLVEEIQAGCNVIMAMDSDAF